jgi:hypothetical protein
MTLLEIQERLIANCGERFSSSVLWRFFDRHDITFKAEEFGVGRPPALDRNAKIRIMHWSAGVARIWPLLTRPTRIICSATPILWARMRRNCTSIT